ncbi:MAG: right-handed parallel beta-helix repeat-containing protein [Clostridia bacterium]|nr:right-handed parallel beta-helix repeat-containing protein [Clostridia bacterium]
MTELTSAGLHFITEPIRIESGTHLKAEPGCRLCGGKKVSAYRGADGRYYIDLENPAPIESRGFGRHISPSHPELFINGRPLVMSRWPRGDFLKMTAFPEYFTDIGYEAGKFENGFFYEDERPKTWKSVSGIGVFGYWAFDWSPTRERIDVLDAERMFIRCLPPYGTYCYHRNQRFYFFNIPEEVTEPGDYAIDYETGRMCFIPCDGTDMDTAEIIVSDLELPILLIENASDVVLEGFTVEACRGTAVLIRGCADVRITGCEFRNIGNRAMNIEQSKDVRVDRCHVHDTGDGGIQIWSGDRKTLERAEVVVENCHLHDISKWDTCYEPPIRLYGVGLTARFNKIHDCPHSAILFGGNYIEITDNEIYRCVMETGDAGAIYGGRDYTFRGNEISRNFIHHLGGRIGIGTMAIYNDDCLSGTVMRDNVIYKVQRGCFLGGGTDFVLDGNVFIDCRPAVEIDGRGASDHPTWRDMTKGVLRERFYEIGGNTPPYLTRWPELDEIGRAYGERPDPFIPPSARITHNVFCGLDEKRRIQYSWWTENGSFTEENNRVIPKDELRFYVTPEVFEVISRDIDTAW